MSQHYLESMAEREKVSLGDLKPPGVPETPIQLPRLMNTSEVARFLRLGRSSTYELIRQGAIPHIRLGRLIRVSRDQLIAWVEAESFKNNSGESDDV
jgi:excisionase family DNA binding protein